VPFVLIRGVLAFRHRPPGPRLLPTPTDTRSHVSRNGRALRPHRLALTLTTAGDRRCGTSPVSTVRFWIRVLARYAPRSCCGRGSAWLARWRRSQPPSSRPSIRITPAPPRASQRAGKGSVGLIATALIGGVIAAKGEALFTAFHIAVIVRRIAALAAGVAAFLLVRNRRGGGRIGIGL
jgi:hypothetical protein